MDKSTGTPTSLEEKKALPNCSNKDGNIINALKICISTSLQQFEVYEMTIPICHWCLVMHFWASSSRLTESKCIFDSCLIHGGIVMLE